MIGRGVTTGIIVTILSCLPGCGEQGAEPPKPPSSAEVAPHAAVPHAIHPPPAVRERLRTEPATRRAVPELVTAPGEVALDLKKVAKITSRIEGQIERIHVQLGDRVTPRQPLAAVGSLQLDQLVEEYLVGKAQADVAENNLRRTEKLRTDDIVPERKLIEDKGPTWRRRHATSTSEKNCWPWASRKPNSPGSNAADMKKAITTH